MREIPFNPDIEQRLGLITNLTSELRQLLLSSPDLAEEFLAFDPEQRTDIISSFKSLADVIPGEYDRLRQIIDNFPHDKPAPKASAAAV